MSFLRTVLVLITLCAVAPAHPMGNFSVNHYSRLHFSSAGADLTYVLDLAEIPTFQLLGSWHATPENQTVLEQKTRAQASEWLAALALVEDGRKISWQLKSITPKLADGAGGMPTLRIVIAAQAPLHAGKVAYDDRNFPGRAGWKEIVIDHSPDAVLQHPSQGARDLSAALTVYPSDPSVTPPQDLTASVKWSPKFAAGATSADNSQAPPVAATQVAPVAAAQVAPVAAAQVASVAATQVAAPSSFASQQPTAPGTVVRGDFLSRMLQKKQLGWRVILLCLLAALGLGAVHAMSPGHGKTIVAAYLVGSRGTLKHAGFLGFLVTFTHTFTVFLLGIGVLFFEQYVVPEKIVPALGMLSGLSIVLVGASLLYRRARALTSHAHHHHHAPDHHHHPHHAHDHHHHDHGHDHHHHHEHVHSHGGSEHSHTIAGDITPAGLIALGVSGGLVPCPSALILMLSAIALGRPGFGLLLLLAFSAGLSLVLIGIGVLALYARQLLPDSHHHHPALRLIPVFSSVVVIVLGLVITAVSAGWIRPLGFLA